MQSRTAMQYQLKKFQEIKNISITYDFGGKYQEVQKHPIPDK